MPTRLHLFKHLYLTLCFKHLNLPKIWTILNPHDIVNHTKFLWGFTMMKILILAALSYSALANCASDYNTGISEYNFAARHYELGSNDFEKAAEESKKEEPNTQVLCAHLLNAYSGFHTASDSLQRCRELFAAAVKSCTGDTKLQAMQASNTCHQSLQVSNENLNIMEQNIKGICFTQDE